ncbi:hypothetical protein [Pseudomonas putida]|uniref:Uncharacterized protein n=1 Tax=Pseudomonas putida TaxID=303 RepID=A0A8I1ECG0_PSEPU|nr:hypothetical protein [Pseudomonas putida]MBI6882739.1 hypothetical protein [Pseudomonas putida]
MKHELIGAIDGCAVRHISLEDFVSKSDYKTVVGSLIDIGTESAEAIPVNDAFIGSLSPKSQGLMLTTALATGNADLYAPLYERVAINAGAIYSQDLPSMLGGHHAPIAISEMTNRASKDLSTLAAFESGIASIKTFAAGGSLATEKSAISSASWVESHPEQSRDLLTIVNSAPKGLELPELKGGALSRFLKAGLKLGALAGVLAGVGLASMYGSAFVHQSDHVGLVSLKERPAIESVDARGNVEQMKVAMHGEIGSVAMAKYYLEGLNGQSTGHLLDSFKDNSRQGVAMRLNSAADDGLDVCLIQSHQTARTSVDGNFYLPSDVSFAIVDKNLLDFYFQSHEAEHCFTNFIDKVGMESSNMYESSYAISLNEISSDLAAIIDYMRITGNADLYTNHIRPQRVAKINDFTHKTAWALDEILKDINPAEIHNMKKEDIPGLTRSIMEKNFMAKDGSFNLSILSSQGKTNVGTAASDALFQEIIASRFVEMMAVNKSSHSRAPELTARLKADVQETLATQYAAYEHTAPDDVLAAARDGYQVLAEKYQLSEVKEVSAPAAQVSAKLDSMATAFLQPSR